jgi:hypothetical protein
MHWDHEQSGRRTTPGPVGTVAPTFPARSERQTHPTSLSARMGHRFLSSANLLTDDRRMV